MFKPSSDQKKAIKTICDWFFDTNRTQFITLGGYAGTGKTTLISSLRKLLHKKRKKLKVTFCTYTGKASRVLDEKLREGKTLYASDSVSTIHSLIYSPIEDELTQQIVGWERKKSIDSSLIVIDEASMVDESIWNDLCSYNIPILAVGDHGQLPPIRGTFDLMENPVLKLEKIHRQVRDNPIIKISILVRERGVIPIKTFGDNVKKISKKDHDSREIVEDLLTNFNLDTMILCGYNSTRLKLNSFIRRTLEYDSLVPKTGDRVICLRNNHKQKINNGMLGTILTIELKNADWYSAEIQMDGEDKPYRGLISVAQFDKPNPMNFSKDRRKIMKGDLFDFGYALTVHKAQGSQAKRVILFEERFPKMDDLMWRRWLYTAVTRAEEELFIVG